MDSYCRTVCEPWLVAEAVEAAFADFLEKVDRHPIGDARLESALMRSTRLTAAEAARVDWDEPGAPEGDEWVRFDCMLTPLFLAGSPGALASVDALARMDAHVLGCPRCRAGARRFQAAEESFPESKDADAPEEVVEALLVRYSSLPDEMQAESEAVEAEAVESESEAVESERSDMEAIALRANHGSEAEPGSPPAPLEEDRSHGSRPRRWLIAAGGVAAVGVAVAVWALLGAGSSEDHSSTSPDRTSPVPAGGAARRAPAKPIRAAPVPVVLAGAKATDYDPNGGNGERPEKVGALIDGNAKTEWQTELYPRGAFGRGVGAYIALPRAERLKAIEIRTTTPGWDAEIYGASAGPPAALPARGWVKLGSDSAIRGAERMRFVNGSQPVRYCLVWITKLPSRGLVSIAEIRLFR